MSDHVYFEFSTGFSKPVQVPKGTLNLIWNSIQHTEHVLGLRRKPTYTPEGEPQRPGWSWDSPERAMLDMAGTYADTSTPQWWLHNRQRDQKIREMGETVIGHNEFVRDLYHDLTRWHDREWNPGESETITVEQSRDFWGGLRILEFPRELWDREFYTYHMEHLHALLTTGESKGVVLDCEPFDATAAEALIHLFDAELDQWGFDARFAIPLDADLRPYDFIRSSYDGGYERCARCGPINDSDVLQRCHKCPRATTGECDLKNEHPEELEGEDE